MSSPHPQHPAQQAPTLASRIFATLRAGEYGQALALSREQAAADPQEQTLLLCARGAFWLHLGQAEQAEAELSAAFEQAALLGRAAGLGRVAGIGYLGLLALARGRPHEAREQFAAAQAVERRLSDPFPWLNVSWGLGQALLGWGATEFERAGRQLQRALAQARTAANAGDRLEILSTQADLALRAGDPQQAHLLLEQGEALVSEHERLPAVLRRRARLWRELRDDGRARICSVLARDLAARRAATIDDDGLRRDYFATQASTNEVV